MTPANARRALALAICALVALAPAAEAMSGSMDLYLQNTGLDKNSARSAGNVARLHDRVGDSEAVLAVPGTSFLYYGTYYIGTPPRRFLGCVDTGSSDTWVPSSACTSTVCQSHDQYDATASSTVQAPLLPCPAANPAASQLICRELTTLPKNSQNTSQFPVSIQYGTGTVSIILTYDTMQLANVSITDQGFGAATSLSYDFASVSCDGLVGLGFQSLSSTGTVPPFLNAVREGVLDQNLFAIWLSPNPGVEPAGQLTMGKSDSSRYTGQLTYISVTRTAYWQVALSQVTVGSTNANVVTSSAILDSGTTAIVLSTSDSNRINSLLPGAVYWSDMLSWNVTCNVAQLPTITFVLGGQQFAVPPRLYVQLLTDTNGVSLGVCASAIVGGGGGSSSGPLAVLGTNFLRAWYSVYKVNQGSGTAQVGLAQSAGSSSVSTGGRRLLGDDEQPLFSMPVHKLAQPKQWLPGSQPGATPDGQRRRLDEGQAEAQPRHEQEAQPQLFSRSADSLGRTKWTHS